MDRTSCVRLYSVVSGLSLLTFISRALQKISDANQKQLRFNGLHRYVIDEYKHMK